VLESFLSENLKFLSREGDYQRKTEGHHRQLRSASEALQGEATCPSGKYSNFFIILLWEVFEILKPPQEAQIVR
jgi:hypothetical protein